MSNAKKGLGRGFDALIPQDLDTALLLEEGERIQNIDTQAVAPSKSQPREHFDETALQELAASIKQHGILQPLVLTETARGTYRIVAGERRWRAARLANLKTVPAIVRSLKALEELEVALIENVQRVDLSPWEQAVSVGRLHTEFNLSHQEIARRLGKAPTTIINIVRLLQLPPAAQKALQQGKISEGHARAILALKATAAQLRLLGLIQKHRWSVRQAEQYVTAHKQGATTTAAATRQLRTTTPATEKLAKLLKTPVQIRRTAKGGKLEIDFKSDAELQRLLRRLTTG